MIQNGIGVVELHAVWVEPRFTGPGVSPEGARDQLRKWRLSVPIDYYRNVKKQFDDAGINVFSYYVGFNDSFTDSEFDATYEGSKDFGRKGGSRLLRTGGCVKAGTVSREARYVWWPAQS